jgi:hydroxymethylglutaryl-CoA lyase
MPVLPAQVRIVEVGPRDGLQNEPSAISVGLRIELIERLADAGLSTIEAGAFVSPRRVPNMAGSADVMQALQRRPGVSYPCLVPNDTGLDAALAAGCDEIAIFAAASDTFSQRNISCGITESMNAATCPACWAAPTKARSPVQRLLRSRTSFHPWAAMR